MSMKRVRNDFIGPTFLRIDFVDPTKMHIDYRFQIRVGYASVWVRRKGEDWSCRGNQEVPVDTGRRTYRTVVQGIAERKLAHVRSVTRVMDNIRIPG